MRIATPARVRIVLRWIQVLHSFDPFFKQAGEFRFVAIVTAHGSPPRITMLPEFGHYSIGGGVAQSRIDLGAVLFEDAVNTALTIEITGEELDLLSRNEQLPAYRRTFNGDPSAWVGWYGPGDDAPGRDPESLGSWRVCYVIETA